MARSWEEAVALLANSPHVSIDTATGFLQPKGGNPSEELIHLQQPGCSIDHFTSVRPAPVGFEAYLVALLVLPKLLNTIFVKTFAVT
jgi:hypothetical protein